MLMKGWRRLVRPLAERPRACGSRKIDQTWIEVGQGWRREAVPRWRRRGQGDSCGEVLCADGCEGQSEGVRRALAEGRVERMAEVGGE